MSATKKPSVAVFTSGGDAPGMNAVVRAVVRTALHYGHDAYAIYEVRVHAGSGVLARASQTDAFTTRRAIKGWSMAASTSGKWSGTMWA